MPRHGLKTSRSASLLTIRSAPATSDEFQELVVLWVTAVRHALGWGERDAQRIKSLNKVCAEILVEDAIQTWPGQHVQQLIQLFDRNCDQILMQCVVNCPF